jgi:hypothetical protein|tara:strand:- start:1337 stop:1507 length:171 start_codon:yes stop_codon:yes gene_type:complete
LQLGVQPKEGQGISVLINQDLYVTLTQLLLAAAKKVDWKFSESQENMVSEERKIIN